MALEDEAAVSVSSSGTASFWQETRHRPHQNEDATAAEAGSFRFTINFLSSRDLLWSGGRISGEDFELRRNFVKNIGRISVEYIRTDFHKIINCGN